MTGARPFSADEMRDVLAKARSPRDYALIETQRWSGLRISEVLSLTTADVARNFNTINDLFQAWQHKTKKPRTIVVCKELRFALLRYFTWLAGRRFAFAPTRPLFFSPRNPRRALSERQAYNIVHGAADTAGLTGKIGTHSLRKTTAHALYAKSKFDIKKVQAFLGHASVASTGHYVGFQEEHEAWKMILDLGNRQDEAPALWDIREA